MRSSNSWVRAAGVAALGLWLAACGPAERPQLTVEVLATGAAISGANGVQISPDGRLFVASVIGSEIAVLDPDTGEMLERLTEGVDGPDDVAFNADGDLFWTSILTGEVAGFRASGERVTAARLTPGVNPLTFSDDGRLFVSQCFFDDKLYEVDPAGLAPERLIADDLGPGCGLNGMDVGPDGRLYGPRWFRQQVVSFDVDEGDMRIEATGFQVPAAVKFDSTGALHVLDTMAGAVIRVEGQKQSVVATFEPGLDNLAFDAGDRLFVSSFVDGTVWRASPDGEHVVLSPGGMAHPGGLAVYPGGDGASLLVADLHALRTFDPVSGEQTAVRRNILGVGELGSVLSVAVDGEYLILTSFTDNNMRIWDPVNERNLLRVDNLQMPVHGIRYRGQLVVSEYLAGQVKVVDGQLPTLLASGLAAPTALLTDGESLWVTDRTRGEVLKIAAGGQRIEPPEVLAAGLNAPEGLALWRGQVLVREGETGSVYLLGGDTPELLVTLGAGSPPASEAQPPSMVLNDIVVVGDRLFGANELSRELVSVDLSPLVKAGG
jgi:sugar lactone lactonase YvrE